MICSSVCRFFICLSPRKNYHRNSRSTGYTFRTQVNISIPESEFSGNYRRGPLWLALYHNMSWLPDPCGTTVSGVEITLSRLTEGTGATFDYRIYCANPAAIPLRNWVP